MLISVPELVDLPRSMSEYHRQRAALNQDFIRHNRKRNHNWLIDSDDDDPPPEVRIPHTQTHLADSGAQSRPARTTYVAGPASPQKNGSSSRSQNDSVEHSYYHAGYMDDTAHLAHGDMGPMETDIEDNESDDDLDPAYQRHLDDQEPGPPKRKRKPRVSLIQF